MKAALSIIPAVIVDRAERQRHDNLDHLIFPFDLSWSLERRTFYAYSERDRELWISQFNRLASVGHEDSATEKQLKKESKMAALEKMWFREYNERSAKAEHIASTRRKRRIDASGEQLTIAS